MAALRDQAKRCRRILKDSLVDFYLPACVDTAHGGYFESLREGKFVGTGEKFLVLQARQLWFFSTLAQEGVRKEAALAAAKFGFDFLENRMRDRRHGGYYAKVSDAGEVKDPRKHVATRAAPCRTGGWEQPGVAGELARRRLDHERYAEEVQDLQPSGWYTPRMSPWLRKKTWRLQD
ncbi:MAG TPA: AGE family epimerase/isomerase [Gemmataceae bacterium]